MEGAFLLQCIALAIQYGPELGIDIKAAIDRLQNGESVDALIAELDAKKNDLQALSFGEG